MITPEENKMLLRRKLLTNIIGEGTFWEGEALELPFSAISDLFDEIEIKTWCRCVGVLYELNEDPDPAYRCPVTVIFRPIMVSNETINDDEL